VLFITWYTEPKIRVHSPNDIFFSLHFVATAGRSSSAFSSWFSILCYRMWPCRGRTQRPHLRSNQDLPPPDVTESVGFCSVGIHSTKRHRIRQVLHPLGSAPPSVTEFAGFCSAGTTLLHGSSLCWPPLSVLFIGSSFWWPPTSDFLRWTEFSDLLRLGGRLDLDLSRLSGSARLFSVGSARWLNFSSTVFFDLLV
jgi:hypothetical protein